MAPRWMAIGPKIRTSHDFSYWRSERQGRGFWLGFPYPIGSCVLHAPFSYPGIGPAASFGMGTRGIRTISVFSHPIDCKPVIALRLLATAVQYKWATGGCH